MSDLLSLLHLGAGGITAAHAGVAAASNNAANANTVGYSRLRVDLEAAPEVGGVRAGAPQRLASAMLASRIRSADGALAMARALGAALSDAEVRLAGTGATLDSQLATLFTRFHQAAASPGDVHTRDAVVVAARDLVGGINRRAADADGARRDADLRIRDLATQATQLATELAASNRAVAQTADPALRDRRDEAARQLVALVGGQARIDGDGQLRLVLDGGAVLVDGTRSAALVTEPDPATGLSRLIVADGTSRRDVTGDLASGAVGGELAFRDRAAVTLLGDLDQLAYDLAAGLDAVHLTHAGSDGGTGRRMFVPLAGVAGAAARLALDPALAADPSRLATAAVGSGPGDNTGALALARLATARLASSGQRTLTDASLDLVARVATEVGETSREVSRGELVADHLAGLRDSVSGVDISEEMTNLARFQHAAAAMTKFVSTIDDMLGTLIGQLR